jgi:hypothetical protein
LKNKRAETVGEEMLYILSMAVISEVLKSDNGGEFLGECIRMTRKHFGKIKIVNDKARKPSTKSSVERGNAPLTRSLFEWIENPMGSIVWCNLNTAWIPNY